MDKVMPIGGYWDRINWKAIKSYSIPWGMIVSHEKQAQLNHCGQTLQVLANRGGLSACEAIAILEDRSWKKMNEEESYKKLKKMAEEYEQRNFNKTS
jgi:hypothetical protein